MNKKAGKRKMLRKWIYKHPVWTWILISVLFAVVIHILFSLSTSHTFFVAKWSAGELLAYSSTVAIGLLAFWQNKQFKEENDKAQARLENITLQANSLSVINKIIEIESENLSKLEAALDEFSTVCDPIEILSVYTSAYKHINASANSVSAKMAMMAQDKRIDHCYFALWRELRIDPQIETNESNPIVKSSLEYYTLAKKVVTELSNNPSLENLFEEVSFKTIKMDFFREREKLLSHKEKMLSKVVFGSYSLDEIKKMYYEEYTSEESANHG